MLAYFEYHNPPPSRDTQADLDRIQDHFARLVNNGFWDRPAKDRALRMRDASERGGAENFFDLPADERARAYGEDE